MIVAGRRSGKTKSCADALIIRALKKRNGRYRWIGPTYKQVNVGVETIQEALEGLPGWRYKLGEQKFVLPNGSTIELMSAGGEASLQGAGFDGVVLDEAAYLKESTWTRDMEPTLLTTGGWAILASKPKGFNWLQKLWEKTKDNPRWLRLEYPSWASPLTSKAEIDELRLIIGDNAWAQEYGGKFVAADTALWPPQFFDDVLMPPQDFPRAFQRCCLAVDLSEGGIKSDWQAIVLLGVLNGHHYVYAENHRTSAPALLQRVRAISDIYRPQMIVVDASASRLFVADEFRRMWPDGQMPKLQLLKEFERKETRIQRLASPLAQKLVKVCDNQGGQEYLAEGRDFPCGEHDDMLDAHEMAWRGLVAA